MDFNLKEDTSQPPYFKCFWFYDDISVLETRLETEADQIQCVVSNKLMKIVSIWQTQHPELWDYADNVDTISFLLTNIWKYLNNLEILTLLKSYSEICF
jgi:hypothetical protein